MTMALRTGCVLLFLAVVAMAEEEEEEKPTQTAVAVAATLIGAISFQMSLLYLTNHQDSDIRYYSYEIINSTVSIFSAVLLFQSANDLVETYIAREKWYVDFIHMAVWYTILQLALAWISGAIAYKWEPPEDESLKELEIEKMELQMKSVAVLLAHLTGFASINAWGSLQQLEYFKTPLMSFLVVPISAVGQFSLQRLTNWIRYKVAMSDDGEEDEFEKMWDGETEECENDVMGLTLSFNLMQACRFLITSVLPNQEGEVPRAKLISHGGNVQVMELYGVAFASMVLMTCMFLLKPKEEEEAKDDEKTDKGDGDKQNEGWSFFEGCAERAEDACILTLSMAFAWGVFFCTRMFLTRFSIFADEMLRAVCLTMILSFVSFSCIRGLDLLSDNWDKATDAIKQIIKAIGILVGFGWEQTFDQAVKSLSSAMPDPHVAKLFLGLFCVAIVVPAWKWYLLPMAIKDGWQFGFVIDSDCPPDTFERIEQHVKKSITQAQLDRTSEPKLGARAPLLNGRRHDELEELQQTNSSLLAEKAKLETMRNAKDAMAPVGASLMEQVDALENLTRILFKKNKNGMHEDKIGSHDHL